MYATISNIRWDYDAPDAVAGCTSLRWIGRGAVHALGTLHTTTAHFHLADIAPPDGAPVRPFHLDPRVTTPKGIADALWARIGEASGAAAPIAAPAAAAAAGTRGAW